MSNEIVPYQLRIDVNVINKIKEFAEEDGRSLNKEIEYILKQYISEHSNTNIKPSKPQPIDRSQLGI